jgi:hypothetical protein
LAIRHEAGRTLVLRNCAGLVPQPATGAGDWFIEDVVCSPLVFANPKQNIWMRQINLESNERTNLENHSATVWILGLKTEGRQTKVLTDRGGKTEVLGAHIYSNNNAAQPDPLFAVRDAFTRFAGIRETCWKGDTPYNVYVRETHGAEIRQLTREGNATGRFMPLYVTGQ